MQLTKEEIIKELNRIKEDCDKLLKKIGIEGVKFIRTDCKQSLPVVPDKREVFGDEYYYINVTSNIHPFTMDTPINRIPKGDLKFRNCRPTESLAKASLALSQLAQLRNETWRRDNNRKPDCNNISQPKYVLCCSHNKISRNKTFGVQYFLAFRTEEIRDEFLNKHRELIEQAKELL